MTTYIIHVTKNPNATPLRYMDYTATFDNYDGAPIDYETPSDNPIGHGIDHYYAIADLLSNAFEKGVFE